jgi:ankyrin repeat protein
MELMDLLLNKGVVIDALDVRGRTPLNRAILASNRDAVRELLKWDASPNQCIDPSDTKPDFPVCDLIDDLSTPLHQAAIHNSLMVIPTLVRYGADLDAIDTHGHTPLELAILHHNPDTATVLNEEIDRLEQERIKHARKLQMMMGNTEHKTEVNISWLKVLDPELIRKILDEGVDFKPEDELQTESENVSDNKPGRSSRSSRKHSSQLSRANGNDSDDDSDN